MTAVHEIRLPGPFLLFVSNVTYPSTTLSRTMKGYFVVFFIAAYCLAAEATNNCLSLAFQTPTIFNAQQGSITQETYSTVGCTMLVIDTTDWPCQLSNPPQLCQNNSQCTSGYCTTNRFCVACSVNGTGHTTSDKFKVISNVTEAIIDKKIWTIDEYYDHPDVDYKQAYQKWSWTPNGKALQNEFVLYWRHLGKFEEGYDDTFITSSEVYEVWNSTHVRYRLMQITRRAHDMRGVIDMDYTSKEQFYVIVNT